MALVPRSFAEAQSFAKALSESSLVPTGLRNNAANTLMMIMAGGELGIAPIASMRVFHVIEGVPKLSADGIAALCVRSPTCEWLRPVGEQTGESVTWSAKRKGQPEFKLSWTQADRDRAGLGNSANHKKYPRAMANARCKAEICRLIWPEICAGMLSAEEHRDAIEADDADFVSIPASSMQPLPSALPDANPTTLEKKREKREAVAPETAEAFAKARENADDIAKMRAEKAAATEKARAEEIEDAEIDQHIANANAAAAARKALDEQPVEKPADLATINDDAVNEIAREMFEAKDEKAIRAIAAKLAALKLDDKQRGDLGKTYKACLATLQKKVGAQ
jgi:hypothetical protein